MFARKKAFLFALVVVADVILILCLYGASASREVWNRFHLLPAAAMFLNPANAALATDIGTRSFNTFGEYGYDLEEAQEYLDLALTIDPLNHTAWYQLSRIDFLNGDFGPALVKMNRQIELHPEFMPAYYVRGLVYAFGGLLNEAEADFLTFLESKEHSWAANNDLSWVYFRQGDYEKALEYAEKGLAHSPDNPWLLTMQGVSLINLGEKKKAAEIFPRALAEAQKLTKEDWLRSYPGNDPAEADRGLAEMIQAIEKNLALVD